MTVIVGTSPLSPADLIDVARNDAQVELDARSLAEVAKTREAIDALASDPEPHYGISTGFGALATQFIPLDMRVQLQKSLVRSHAAGSG